MIIGIPKETAHGEKRIGVTPATIKELVKKGFKILIEKGKEVYYSL